MIKEESMNYMVVVISMLICISCFSGMKKKSMNDIKLDPEIDLFERNRPFPHVVENSEFKIVINRVWEEESWSINVCDLDIYWNEKCIYNSGIILNNESDFGYYNVYGEIIQYVFSDTLVLNQDSLIPIEFLTVSKPDTYLFKGVNFHLTESYNDHSIVYLYPNLEGEGVGWIKLYLSSNRVLYRLEWMSGV